MAKLGSIIYFDGPDGAGKTTQLKRASEALREQGYNVHHTRSMGGTPLGELLREAALSPNNRPVETDLYIALACQHALAADILLRREAGEIILVDRSPLSIIAYQVFGDGLDKTIGYEAVQEVLNLIQPNLMITYAGNQALLDARRKQRNRLIDTDYFESKSRAYHHRVAKGFAEGAKHFAAVIVDCEPSIAEVHDITMQMISKSLTN
jgi:dTMP kinase